MTSMLAWHTPAMLGLLAVPALVVAFRRIIRPRDKAMEKFAARPLWPYLISYPATTPRVGLLVVAWCLAAIAAGGPHLRANNPLTQTAHSSDIVFVVDISPSMEARDVTPSRLQRAKWLIDRISAQRPGDYFALVAYSANAYPVVPFTQDIAVLRHFTEALRTDLVRQSGSNLARALERAGALVKSENRNSAAIIVLSDGETHSPGLTREVEALRTRAIAVSTIAIGSPLGTPLVAADGSLLQYRGELVISRTDRATLANIAGRTGGRALIDDGSLVPDLSALMVQLDQAARTRATTSPDSRHELLPWLLVPSLILLFVWLYQVRVLAFTAILIMAATPPPAGAAPWVEEQALQALQREEWEQAATLYRTMDNYAGKMGQGAVAFRRGQWREAADAFDAAADAAHSSSEQASAFYNLGNAQAHAGEFARARIAYQAALSLQPNFPRATQNLNLITELERHPSARLATNPQSAGQNATQPKNTPDGFNAAGDTRSPRTGTVATAELGRENTSTLLQRRFLQRDALDRVGRDEDKPW